MKSPKQSIINFWIPSSRSRLTMLFVLLPILLLTLFRTIRHFFTFCAFLSLFLPTNLASRLQRFNIRIIIDRVRISKDSQFLPCSFCNSIPRCPCRFNVRSNKEWGDWNASEVWFKRLPYTSWYNWEISSNFPLSARTDRYFSFIERYRDIWWIFARGTMFPVTTTFDHCRKSRSPPFHFLVVNGDVDCFKRSLKCLEISSNGQNVGVNNDTGNWNRDISQLRRKEAGGRRWKVSVARFDFLVTSLNELHF